jgi:hypothetical protein
MANMPGSMFSTVSPGGNPSGRPPCPQARTLTSSDGRIAARSACRKAAITRPASPRLPITTPRAPAARPVRTFTWLPMQE